MKITQRSRIQKALIELDYLEYSYEVTETPDFVEVIGGQGGDVERYRVYFDENDEIERVVVK